MAPRSSWRLSLPKRVKNTKASANAATEAPRVDTDAVGAKIVRFQGLSLAALTTFARDVIDGNLMPQLELYVVKQDCALVDEEPGSTVFTVSEKEPGVEYDWGHTVTRGDSLEVTPSLVHPSVRQLSV
jgi:hypothetical protein